MSLLHRLLLLPLLAPLLAVLLIGVVNPRPAVRLRLLTWTSPPMPVGVWLLLAAGGGALLSAGATALALQGEGQSRQRRVVREVWPEAEPPRPRGQAAAAPPPPAGGGAPVQPSAGPCRQPGEPAPTVAVAYRVIRRPARQPAPTAAGESDSSGGSGGLADGGWDAPPGEDW